MQHAGLKPKKCQRLRLRSPWAPSLNAQTRSSPRRGSWWIWARIGFYSTLVMRGNNARPHILWRCTILFSSIFLTNFDLSPADKTTGGRTLCPIEISDTEPTRNEYVTSLKPLTCSWFFKGDSQHCHSTPETSSEALKLVFFSFLCNPLKTDMLAWGLNESRKKIFLVWKRFTLHLWIFIFFFPMQWLLRTRKLKDTLAEIHLTLYYFRAMGFPAL